MYKRQLSEGDELIAVMKTDGKQDILLASANGMVICFNENDVRVMGREDVYKRQPPDRPDRRPAPQ